MNVPSLDSLIALNQCFGPVMFGECPILATAAGKLAIPSWSCLARGGVFAVCYIIREALRMKCFFLLCALPKENAA